MNRKTSIALLAISMFLMMSMFAVPVNAWHKRLRRDSAGGGGSCCWFLDISFVVVSVKYPNGSAATDTPVAIYNGSSLVIEGETNRFGHFWTILWFGEYSVIAEKGNFKGEEPITVDWWYTIVRMTLEEPSETSCVVLTILQGGSPLTYTKITIVGTNYATYTDEDGIADFGCELGLNPNTTYTIKVEGIGYGTFTTNSAGGAITTVEV